MAEEDPELREKLWDEYRRYKASLGGSNKDGK
jgi:protein-S-isoprenylcysteine O-methyltransferase Ste14